MQGQNVVLMISLMFGMVIIVAFIFQLRQKQQREKDLSKVLDANLINTHKDIRAILKMVQEERVPFVVRKNGRGKTFNSFLINTNFSPKSPTILIDSLVPEEGNELVLDSQFISIEFFLKKTESEYFHTPYTFNAIYLNSETYKGHPALRLSFPKNIKRTQRRDYNRIEPSREEPINVTLTLKDRKVTENVVNLSGGGVGFYTNLDESVIQLGKKIDLASFALPDGTEITSKLIIRWISKNVPEEIRSRKRCYLYCGAEFIDLDKVLCEKIIKYVLKKERDDLKKMSMEFE